ncbi:suppressor of fused domain protein [Streptomyces sp. NPDC003480]
MVALRRRATVTTQEVRAHYLRAWGEPSREAAFSLGEHKVEIFKWNHDRTDEGVTLYATCGASRALQSGPGALHRVEFVTGLLPEEDGIARGLAILGTYPLTGRHLSYGESITLPDPLWAGGRMTSFLAVRPMEDLVPDLALPDGSHVQFMNVVPVFESELRLRNGRSAEWLIGELNDNGVAWWDPRRGPLGC